MPEYMSMLCTSNILTKHSLKEKRLAFHSTGNGVNGLGKSLAGLVGDLNLIPRAKKKMEKTGLWLGGIC
jgi:hypothetical protein